MSRATCLRDSVCRASTGARSLVGAGLCVLLFAGFASGQTTTRVSVASGGAQGTGVAGSASYPAISPDGRFVAFASDHSNLVSGDTSGSDVFVHDRQTAQTTRVSLTNGGAQGSGGTGGGGAFEPSISADGRYVTFSSLYTNLVTGDTNNRWDIFVRDRQAATTTRVSVATGGAQGTGGTFGSVQSEISGDGRYVVFGSDIPNLVVGDTNGVSDIFLHDRDAGQTTRVSLGAGGEQTVGESYGPTISADGRFIAYTSLASNIVAGDTNGKRDVFVFDRTTSQTTLVSLTSGNTLSNNESFTPSLSYDGRYVAFGSYGSNLVPGDTNNRIDIFVRDRQLNLTVRASVGPAGVEAVGGVNGSQYPAISGDGRFLAFESETTNLVAGDTNNRTDVFLRDLVLGETVRIGLGPGGVEGAGGQFGSYTPAISSTGRFVSFVSQHSNLVAGDTNGVYEHVCLRESCRAG